MYLQCQNSKTVQQKEAGGTPKRPKQQSKTHAKTATTTKTTPTGQKSKQKRNKKQRKKQKTKKQLNFIDNTDTCLCQPPQTQRKQRFNAIRPQQHAAGTQQREICQRIVNRQFF